MDSTIAKCAMLAQSKLGKQVKLKLLINLSQLLLSSAQPQLKIPFQNFDEMTMIAYSLDNPCYKKKLLDSIRVTSQP